MLNLCAPLFENVHHERATYAKLRTLKCLALGLRVAFHMTGIGHQWKFKVACYKTIQVTTRVVAVFSSSVYSKVAYIMSIQVGPDSQDEPSWARVASLTSPGSFCLATGVSSGVTLNQRRGFGSILLELTRVVVPRASASRLQRAAVWRPVTPYRAGSGSRDCRVVQQGIAPAHSHL